MTTEPRDMGANPLFKGLPLEWRKRPRGRYDGDLREHDGALTLVDHEGCPYAVQWARLILNDEGTADRITWRDCLGRLYETPLNWVLCHDKELTLRTADHLHVCLRYATYLLERDWHRWWESSL